MTTELLFLTYAAIFTALMWVPYVINLIAVLGLSNAVGYPENPAEKAAWATRLKAAHYNSVENLVVFSVLVVVAHLAGISNEVTVLSAKVYFFARIIHTLVYTFGIPWLRTFSFAASWVAMMVFAFQIVSA